MSSRFLMRLMSVAVLSSCVIGSVGNKIQLSYVPSPQEVPGLVSKTFSLEVTDRRPYVTHGKKVPSYLGIYRGGYGNPFDVVNKGKVALADQMKADLMPASTRAFGTTPNIQLLIPKGSSWRPAG